MFDLPVKTSSDLKEYRVFRNYLLTNGFVMLQKSIYTRISLNLTHSNTIINNIGKNRPANGLVQILRVTEKQYNQMILISGEVKNEHLDSDARLVVL